MMKRILLFALAMLPLVAGAQDVKQLKKQAKAGDAEAALALGRYHEKLEEYKKAEKYYRQAATPQADYDRAIGYIASAAENGNIDAMLLYAKALAGGNGLEADPDTAFQMVSELAPAMTDGEAYTLLGLMHYSGHGTPEDFHMARLCYDSAIAQGGTRAFNLYNEAAERGSSYGMFLVGMCYIDGVYVQEDSEQAFQWFLRAAEAGNLQSCYNVGLMYHTGEGVKKNKKEAKRWLTLAADNGHPAAADLLKTL